MLLTDKQLDVVFIGVVRPDIIKITLSSFKQNLLKNFNTRLIVNIDPIGETDGFSQQDIIDICKQYFDEVICRTPSVPSFSEAVKWCWNQVESDFFFHLEDDWCLKRKIDISFIDDALNSQEVVSVRLNLTSNSKFKSDNFACSDGLSLNPSFFKSNYIKGLLNRFDTSKDPEKQFRDTGNTETYPQPKFVYYGKPNEDAIVIDTGKKWRKSNSLAKWDLTNMETVTWKKGNSVNMLKRGFLKFKYLLFISYWAKRYCNKLKVTLNGLKQA